MPRSDDRSTDRGLPSRIVAHIHSDVPLVLLDATLILIAYLIPLALRFEGGIPGENWRAFWMVLPAIAGIHLAANFLFGLYGEMWRYASVEEARRVALAGIVAGGLVIAGDMLMIDTLIPRERPIPLAVVMLGSILALIGFGTVRFQSRLFAFKRRTEPEEHHRVLLVGAGQAGAMVSKDLRTNRHLGLRPVGFVDDDPRKIGLALQEVRVLGPREAIPSLVERLRVDQVLLTIPSATSEVVRDVAALCEQADVTLKVLPSVRDIMGGKVAARDIRDLRIEDLLGRSQADIDLEAVAAFVRHRRVLVTGAGGSIGAEICRQVAAFDPAALTLLDHDETHLHDVLTELEGDVPIETALVDIRDRERVIRAMMRHRPQVVFHAAAHKHVPLLEIHPEEAVLTNVMGTANVVDAAVAAHVERFVLISTDKAVKPVSVMGASKWLAEQIARSALGNGSIFCAVRFGNVLGSRGSVIPTMFRQIARGGPVTVTHPAMSRYFMSIQEAVELVLQAAALAEGGEVFTLEMGEPVNILDMAKRIIRLSGRVPGKDVRISIIGARPGEKLVEDVIDPDEELLSSAHPDIMVSRPVPPSRSALHAAIGELDVMVRDGRTGDLADHIKAVASGLPVPLDAEAAS
ncbi:MAG TPA: nucleoside-diphosphate sugar epimerase/dehydratase [Actinomycetota bacterium]